MYIIWVFFKTRLSRRSLDLIFGLDINIFRCRKYFKYISNNFQHIQINLAQVDIIPKSILNDFEKEGGTSKSHSPKSQSFFKKIK